MRINISFKDIRQWLRYILGLAVYSCAAYAFVKTDLGLGPWEMFSMGISYHTPLTFGQAIIATSAAIVIIDIVLKGTIGVGILLDLFLVGIFVDIVMKIDFLPELNGLPLRIGIYLIAVAVATLGMFITLTAAQGVGPRDTLMLVLGNRLSRVPIGVIQSAILLFAFLSGLLLGGPVGVGTIISVTCMGPILQFYCRIFHFEPRDVDHKSLADYFRPPETSTDGDPADAPSSSDPE